jgi:hypothetical protein
MTYVRIPANHPKYPFPYNLEDRVKYIIDKIKSGIKVAIDIKIDKHTIKSGPNKGKPGYTITIKHKSQLEEFTEILKKQGAVFDKDTWIINIE